MVKIKIKCTVYLICFIQLHWKQQDVNTAMLVIFETFLYLLMNTSLHLIRNTDETSSESSRKYKVLMINFIKDPICTDTKYFIS